MGNVLAPAPYPEPTGRLSIDAKIGFCAMPQDGDETLVICPVLTQDKMGLNRMIKVYCFCKRLAHVNF